MRKTKWPSVVAALLLLTGVAGCTDAPEPVGPPDVPPSVVESVPTDIPGAKFEPNGVILPPVCNEDPAVPMTAIVIPLNADITQEQIEAHFGGPIPVIAQTTEDPLCHIEVNFQLGDQWARCATNTGGPAWEACTGPDHANGMRDSMKAFAVPLVGGTFQQALLVQLTGLAAGTAAFASDDFGQILRDATKPRP